MKSECRALVPLSPVCQAALKAATETENRRQRGSRLAAYPYATAFFRFLSGCRRVSLDELRLFSPTLTADALRGSRSQWLNAVDMLIESRGEICCLPLPSDAGDRLFPSVRFRAGERDRQKMLLKEQKYSRQLHREAVSRERAYQARVGQAEIELAFHTPATVGSWLSRWSGSDVPDYELESLFWRWSERFPSLAGFERGLWQDVPLWRVVHEAGLSGREASAHVRELERWMVPNKLRDTGGVR
ncbi:plasmid SOS inhibition protein A [Salmonella enterica subsp. enterica serovar Muenchen]|nr:plasmid SOS inhibition protein A [Salmonella enterica]EBV3242537.1 plasmid SOS inhibition protein A [Salmonella enterica subsp. enterica serovar Oranienburg]ECF6948234.1 plasmid SOS inhibition protein A [Salmonella enterica subsp. diarizonae]ECT8844035.1 plasmid SOS inhibition protein A [Salmonella enterica subsp. enterica serovar Muenchen]EFO9813173.1 plasmid SOS inhibition protein A [Salmonella enterica subsp. enterica serovar Enteritidis]HBZ8552328.1 plasmid SOS inhibition protein A [Sal